VKYGSTIEWSGRSNIKAVRQVEGLALARWRLMRRTGKFGVVDGTVIFSGAIHFNTYKTVWGCISGLRFAFRFRNLWILYIICFVHHESLLFIIIICTYVLPSYILLLMWLTPILITNGALSINEGFAGPQRCADHSVRPRWG